MGSWTNNVSEPEEEEENRSSETPESDQSDQSNQSDESDQPKKIENPDKSAESAEPEQPEQSNGSPEPSIDSVEEIEEVETGSQDQSPQKDPQTRAMDSGHGGPPTFSNAMSVDQAAAVDRRWKILVWGPPGLFKSHFCYSAPDPIAYIDLENKAHDIAGKFSDKEIQIWQPDDFDGAQEALSEALEYLDWWRETESKTGTIVVDSMSVAWEWAQTKYKSESYPMKDNKDVSLSANIGDSKESDWVHIKGMHNDEFRKVITESPYHFVWTAGAKEDYQSVFSGEAESGTTPMTDDGEKNNVHKVDSIIRARYNDNGEKVGDMTKSNFTDNKLQNLKRPTFSKFVDAVERIEEAEAADDSVSRSELNGEIDAEIIRGKPE